MADNRMTREVTPEGNLQFYIDVKVSAAEMREWAPERIMALFRGVAAVFEARGEQPISPHIRHTDPEKSTT